MNQTKHTPGPWVVEHPYGEPGVYVTAAHPARSNPLICRLVDQAQAEEGQANAHLIAQAPRLLTALQDALRILVTPSGVPDKGKGRTLEQQTALDNARAVLADVERAR